MFENTIGCINKGVLFHDASEMGLKVRAFSQKTRMDLGILKDIENHIIKNNIEIVNFHGANPNFLYFFLKHKVSIPGVTTLHSDYRYDFINSRIKHLLFTPLNSMALRKFDNYICVSGKIKDLLNEKGFKGAKFIVNNGIDNNRSITVSRDDIRKRYNIGEDTFIYTMVARMHPIKNHKGVVKAFSRLKKEYKNVKLLLVGSGDCEGEIRQRVKEEDLDEYIIFTGHQDNPVEFINAGDINILTSFNETFPIVIMEGALVKKTAICSDVGDVGNIINSTTGFLINPQSEDDIYLKMKEAYLKKDELQQMGLNLYTIVSRDYSMEKFCMRYYEAYKSILAGEIND